MSPLQTFLDRIGRSAERTRHTAIELIVEFLKFDGEILMVYFDEFQSRYNCIIKGFFPYLGFFQKFVHCVCNILLKIAKMISFFIIEIFLVLQKVLVMKKLFLSNHLLVAK